MKLENGDKAPLFIAEDIFGERVDLNKLADKKIMLSFLRNVDCIMCNLRVQELLNAKEMFLKNNIRLILFLQSQREDILETMIKDRQFPYTLIPDPGKEIYKQYGVESSILATIRSMMKIGRIMKGIKAGIELKIFQRGDLHLMPADFLINNGIIEKAYYGKTSGDHINNGEIVEFAGVPAQD